MSTAANEPASCAPEREVLAIERREIWRHRVRQRLPFPNHRTISDLGDPSAREWVDAVLALADCIDDKHEPAEAVVAIAGRCEELLTQFEAVSGRLTEPRRVHRYYRNRRADAFLVDPHQEDAIDLATGLGRHLSAEAAAYLARRSPLPAGFASRTTVLCLPDTSQ